MATFYFTKLAVPSEENSFHSEIFCHTCRLNSIPSPEGATPSTRYTCPSCCDLLLRSRDNKTADMFAVMSDQIERRRWQETIFAAHLSVGGG